MKPIRALIELFPGGKSFAERLSQRRRARNLAPLGDVQGVFSHYYAVNQWKNAESASGVGSTFENTASIRAALPALFDELGVRTILDAPCGDYNWFQYVVRGAGVQYIGGDIVKELVAVNQERYGNATTRFEHVDIVHDTLPTADLWLCRDCLPHLSYELIAKAVKNFLDSDIRFLLTTVHPSATENADILTGDFRPLNLEHAPFAFPPPMQRIDDTSAGLEAKELVLWSREGLREALATNDFFR